MVIRFDESYVVCMLSITSVLLLIHVRFASSPPIPAYKIVKDMDLEEYCKCDVRKATQDVTKCPV